MSLKNGLCVQDISLNNFKYYNYNGLLIKTININQNKTKEFDKDMEHVCACPDNCPKSKINGYLFYKAVSNVEDCFLFFPINNQYFD